MTPLARQLRMIAQSSRSLGGRPVAAARRGLGLVAGCSATRSFSDEAGTSRPAVGRLARVEAVLFLAKESLSTRRIAQLANLEDATEARTLLSQLTQQHQEKGRAFELQRVADGVRLLTRPQFAPWIAKLSLALSPESTLQESGQLKLTPPALDTLVVVAYRQPVLRSEVEAIRGVGCGELLRQLIERGLLRIFGRSEELGRPLLYGTTKQFLQVFGLKNLADLPRIDDLAQAAHHPTEASPLRKAA